MFWNGSKSLGGPLISSFGNLGVVGDLLGGSVVTDGHGNFNCFRGPDVMKKKFPSKPDTANESLLGFRGIEGSVCYSRYSACVVVILSMLNQIPPYFLKSLRHHPPLTKAVVAAAAEAEVEAAVEVAATAAAEVEAAVEVAATAAAESAAAAAADAAAAAVATSCAGVTATARCALHLIKCCLSAALLTQ